MYACIHVWFGTQARCGEKRVMGVAVETWAWASLLLAWWRAASEVKVRRAASACSVAQHQVYVEMDKPR